MENNRFSEFVSVAHSSEAEKIEFYKKTYAHVAAGVLAFILVEYFMLQSEALINFMLNMFQGVKFLIILVAFGFATSRVERIALESNDRNKQYLAYGAYVVLEALIFVPLLFIAIAYTNSFDLLYQASIVTLSLFTGLTAVVFVTKKDFSFLRSILTVGFFIAIGLFLAGMLFGFDLGLWFSVGMCVLAAGSILFQTSNLVHKYRSDQYVPAAIGLFSSVMLLFWYVIQIFLSRD